MGKEEILEEVAKAITKILYVDAEECKLNANLKNDLGTDSLDEIELIMALEMAFNMSVSDEEVERIETVGDIVDFVEKKLKHK